jgi:hypothetical protein
MAARESQTSGDSGITIEEAVDGIRDAVAAILDRHEDCSREGSRVIRLLSVIEKALRHGVPAPAGAERQLPDIEPSRRYKAKRYEAQRVGNEEFLAEFRFDSPFPFRCPKRVLDAVSAVVETAGRPLSFVEIQELVAKRLGEGAPDYQLRVCLRFLCSSAVEVARRQRARFVAVHHGSRNALKAAWKSLKVSESSGS